MIRFSKLSIIIFCIALLVPGYALGAATFTFEHVQSVTVGQCFDVRVYLESTAPHHH